MNKMLASICVITYNQEAYIAQCIEGALSQQCNFEYEIVINDDGSKDNTSAICKQYAQKYPNKVRYILNEKNLGMVGNWVAGIQRCRGKYIALCEGDDFFTDGNKLTEQVHFLEKTQTIVFAFIGLIWFMKMALNIFTGISIQTLL